MSHFFDEAERDRLLPDKPPLPLLDLQPYATRVAELIQNHNAMTYWREMLHQTQKEDAERIRQCDEWDKQYEGRDPLTIPVDQLPDETQRPPSGPPLPFSDNRPRTLADCYAILAAIHDNILKGIEKIDPEYRSLLDRVKDLRESDRANLDQCLRSIQADLEQRFPVANRGEVPLSQRQYDILESLPAGSETATLPGGPAVVQAEATPAAIPGNNASLALMRVFTNGIADDRIERATRLLANDQLTANEKLTEIDALIPFPATTSAEQLGEMLGVTKQAVLKTDWWIQKRKGEKESEIGRRRDGHRKRAKSYEAPGQDDDE